MVGAANAVVISPKAMTTARSSAQSRFVFFIVQFSFFIVVFLQK